MAVKWGGKSFNTSGELAKWLASRGGSYATWAGKHQGAAAKLDPGPARSVPAFQNQIQNEGIFASQNAQSAANTAVSQSDGRAAIDAAAVDLGYAPAGLGIGEAAQRLASVNPYSQKAFIDKAAKGSHGMNMGDAAARGVVGSGGVALRAGEIEFDRGHKMFQANRDFMGIVADANRRNAETTREGAMDVYGNLGDATDRLMNSSFRPAAGAAAGAGGATGRPAAGIAPPNVQGVTFGRDGFATAPAGGYRNEAERQAVIAYNSALGRRNPNMYVDKKAGDAFYRETMAPLVKRIGQKNASQYSRLMQQGKIEAARLFLGRLGVPWAWAKRNGL